MQFLESLERGCIFLTSWTKTQADFVGDKGTIFSTVKV